MEDAQFARDIASGVYIIDLPSAQAAIPGGLESPATSFAGSDETKVLEEPIVVDGGSSSSNIPDGGFRAWLVVVGGFLDFAIAFGKFAANLLFSFSRYIGSLNCTLGLILCLLHRTCKLFWHFSGSLRSSMDLAVYIHHHLDWQRSGMQQRTRLRLKMAHHVLTSYHSPQQLFILFLGGAVVGPIFDKYGSRALMLSGTAVCLLSFICSSFAAHYYQYLLSQGILLGIGNALL